MPKNGHLIVNSTPVDAMILLNSSSLPGGEGRRLGSCKFLGRSAVQRLLYQFAQSGMQHCLVVVDADGAGSGFAKVVFSQKSEIDLNNMHLSVSDSNEQLSNEWVFADQVMLVAGNMVLDTRFFEKISEYGSPVKFVSDDGAEMAFAKVGGGQIGEFMNGDRDLNARLAGLCGMTNIRESAVPQYVPNMRRTFRPYWQELIHINDLKSAADKVMDAAQKGVLDFPARYLHPLPENIMARAAAPTPITPNQITIVSAVLAFAGTYLFATQWYFSALMLALAAGILDGVDGKLARIKLLSTPYGDRLDHTLDVSFEFSWYIALGWGLSQTTGNLTPFMYGFVIIGIMCLARILSGTYLYLTGRQIHDHTAFDRAVRLFAGRRNIYVLVLLVGYLMNSFLESFYVVVAWGFATVVLYAMRNIIAFIQKLAPA